MKTKVQFIVFSLLAISTVMTMSCGKAVPLDPNATTESPGITKTQIGQVFDMALATDPITRRPIPVANEMSITIAGPATITGKFNCYIGGVFRGTVDYSADAKWDRGSTLNVRNFHPSITGCVSNRYFGFMTQMKFAFSTDKTTLQINDLGLTQTTEFHLRN